MLTDTPGIHHVTSLVEGAQRNLDFYVGVLGLRLVIRTVNQEDMLRHHLFYGNEAGDPGTVLTCFPYPNEQPGRVGKPQISAMAFTVPPGSLSYWQNRLGNEGVSVSGPIEQFGDRVIRFEDPDGTRVELVEGDSPMDPWTGGPVPAEHAIRNVHSVTVLPLNPYTTAGLLETLGFELEPEEPNVSWDASDGATDEPAGTRIRYRAGGDYANVVDIVDRQAEFGREGTGSIQHFAVRAESVDELYEWHDLFRERDYDVSRVRDRYFFHSLYVRDPGGIPVELATERPGLAADEDVEDLGESLVLPDQFEEDRELVGDQLSPIDLPAAVTDD
jgi:glyoxalase family protein